MIRPALLPHPGPRATHLVHGAGATPSTPTLRWNFDSFLAGLSLALFPFGNFGIQVQGARAIIPAYSAPLILLAFNLAVRAFMPHARRYPGLTGNVKLVVAIVLLIVMTQAMHGLGGVAGYTVAVFVLGTVGGIMVGTCWALASRGVGWVDIGATLAVVTIVLQLALRFANVGSASGFHGASVLSWGGSNYVAGVLVVLSLALAARIRELGYRPVLLTVPVVGIVAAALTFSRGALIAAGAGVLVLFWNVGRRGLGRSFLRTVGLGIAAAGIPIMQYIVAARSAGGFDPSQNVRGRFELAQVALADFQSSPIIGTGWLSLRDARVSTVQISYAHNVFASFLQIAGLFGGVFLVILMVCAATGLKRSPLAGAAVVAALVISMSDPFFEGGVSALVAWASIVRARDLVALDEGATQSSEPQG